MEEPLPPLIFTNKDQEFLKAVYTDIQENLQQLTHINQKNFFTIYKQAFEKVIDYVTSYSHILQSIKSEYESLIEAVERGHREERNLKNLMEELIMQPSTLENYHKYIQELLQKKAMLQHECEELESDLTEVSNPIPSTPEPVEPSAAEQAQIHLHGRGPLPGMSSDSALDYDAVIAYRRHLERQLRELRLACKTRFFDKEKQNDLEHQLEQIYEKHLTKQKQVRQLQRRCLLLRAAKSVFDDRTTASQAIESGIFVEKLLKILRHTRHKTLPLWLLRGGAEGDDDDAMEMEEELDSYEEQEMDELCSLKSYHSGMEALKCTQLFLQLMEEQHYREAAILAASSPQGCLVHLQTIHQLREIEEREGEELSENCLMEFCERALTLGTMRGQPPNALISLECAQCALQRLRLDFIHHWITNRSLCYSEALGDLLKSHAILQNIHSSKQLLFELAGVVYSELALSSDYAPLRVMLLLKCAECWMECERVNMALHQLQQVCQTDLEFHELCQELFQRIPCPSLARFLHRECVLTWPQILRLCRQSGERSYELVIILNEVLEEEREKDPSVSMGELLSALQIDEIMSWREWIHILEADGGDSCRFTAELIQECTVQQLLHNAQ